MLTSDEEHPGLLAPLGRARVRSGIEVRTAPFATLAEAVTPDTRLVACSHVSWISGGVVDIAALVATGVPVLLDAAQATRRDSGRRARARLRLLRGSGQKWLCGPEGSGCLFVRAERLDELLVPWPGYGSVADPADALEFAPA